MHCFSLIVLVSTYLAAISISISFINDYIDIVSLITVWVCIFPVVFGPNFQLFPSVFFHLHQR